MSRNRSENDGRDDASPFTAPALVIVLFGVWFAMNVFALWGVRREFRSVVGCED